MSEEAKRARPLTTPDQHRHLRELVACWTRAVKRANEQRLKAVEADEQWKLDLECIEELEQQMSEYTSKARPVVAVKVDDGLFLLHGTTVGRARVEQVLFVEGE